MKRRARQGKGNATAGDPVMPELCECVMHRVCPGCRGSLVVRAGNIAPPGDVPRSPVLDCRLCKVSFQISEPQSPLLLSGAERERLLPIAAAVVQVLLKGPSMSLRKVRIAVRGVLGRCTDANTDAALRLLGPSVQRVAPSRRGHQLSINYDKVPLDVRSSPVRRRLVTGATVAPR